MTREQNTQSELVVEDEVAGSQLPVKQSALELLPRSAVEVRWPYLRPPEPEMNANADLMKVLARLADTYQSDHFWDARKLISRSTAASAFGTSYE